MNNIPVYLSQGGTATLILREIPHKKTAYIILRSFLPQMLPLMIQDCVDFCKGCGAEQCLLSSEDPDVKISLPKAYEILIMQGNKAQLPPLDTPAILSPVTPENDSIYQRIYNQCFGTVSHALTYEHAQLERIYREGHHAFLALTPEEQPWGMGELHTNELAAVGILPEFRGQGKRLTLSLLRHCPGPELTLTVVSDNQKAIGLYEALGFRITGTESTWYQA